MQCDYFDRKVCRSCSLMGTGYADQLASLQARVAALLPDTEWKEPVANVESGFRNKAKLVVGGTKAAPTFGIMDSHNRGVDLRHCGLYEPGLAAAVRHMAELVPQIGLTPYDVNSRVGELKHLIITHSPSGQLMIRFVLRSEGQVNRIRTHLGNLPDQAAVVSANIQPEHKAVLEGEHEEVLSEGSLLPMPVNDIELLLGPRSFFQTSTAMAAELYQRAREWGQTSATVLDLFCGVGGFALHLARDAERVEGLEISPEAISAATSAAARAGVGDRVNFESGDALSASLDANLIVVNPPRRGIGSLAARINTCRARRVLYSSCNPRTLALDLAEMNKFRLRMAQSFDMFPHTEHLEVLALLERS